MNITMAIDSRQVAGLPNILNRLKNVESAVSGGGTGTGGGVDSSILADVGDLQTEVASLKSRISAFEARLDAIASSSSGSSSSGGSSVSDETITQFQNHFTTLDGQVSTLTNSLNTLRNQVNSIGETEIDTSNFATKAQINDINSRLSTISTGNSNNYSRLNTLEGYFTDGSANSAKVAYAIPTSRKVSDASGTKAIWYES